MQVSQVNEYVTHAVIGNKQAIEFGISNSSEFFNILSSTLYKDQILAVVRETLCNAWDAHIEAGCTATPVQITLDNDKFVIKDFGKGIHHDDMGLIYGTYGNSTKKNDGMQTGGFGLGCKAPFAYTDHFEVTSCHDGVKTIYNLSKSSAQAQGKPGIIPIASFPTTESGLTVSIRIKASDRSRFSSLIKRIARNGEMNMTLNAEPLPTLGFDSSKNNYLLINDGNELLDTEERLMIRYGNVIYPMEVNSEMGHLYKRMMEKLNKLHSRYDNPYNLILQAPPHSISVTPSREALSMQEHTVKTLTKLLEDFLALEVGFKVECEKRVKTAVVEAVKNKRIDLLLNRDPRLPEEDGIVSMPTITDVETMAKQFLRSHYPDGVEFRKDDITRRLKLMAQDGLLDRGKVQTFLRAMDEVKANPSQSNRDTQYDATNWLQRRVIAPLVKKMPAAGLSHQRLYVRDTADNNYAYRNGKRPNLIQAKDASPTHLFQTLPYLRNIIVISSRFEGVPERAVKHEVFAETGTYDGYLVYVVSRKVSEIETARKFFADLGMRVVVLTVRQEWEPEPVPHVVTQRKPKEKGLVKLSVIKTDHNTIDRFRSRKVTDNRIEQPEFVIQLTARQGDSDDEIGPWSRKTTKTIVELFGDKGGIATTSVVADKYRKAGAKDFDDYIEEKVCDYVKNNQHIQEYFQYRPGAVNKALASSGGIDYEDVVELIYGTPALRQEFQLVNNLTEEDQKYLTLFEFASERYSLANRKEYDATAALSRQVQLAPSNLQLIAKIKDNTLLQLLSMRNIKKIIQDPNHPKFKSALEILINIING